MTAVSIEQAHRARYAKAREALWGKPRVVNIHSEIRHRIEEQRKEARRKWEREQEAKKREIEAPRKSPDANPSEFSLSFQVSSSFDVYDGQHNMLAVDILTFRPTMEQIANNVLQRFPGITLEIVRAPGRTKELVAARKVVVETIHRVRPDKKFAEIARFMRRNHTTILWMLDRLERKRKRRAA